VYGAIKSPIQLCFYDVTEAHTKVEISESRRLDANLHAGRSAGKSVPVFNGETCQSHKRLNTGTGLGAGQQNR